MADFLKAALPLLERGWAVFPVVKDGKVPMTRNGFKDATREKVAVVEWSNRYPDANVGIATGLVSGILVVDVDVKNGKEGKSSVAMMPGWIPKDTYTIRTPSRGLHYYYLLSEPIRSRNGFLPGVDVKADGGYVLGPGSDINGKDYRCVLNIPLLPAKKGFGNIVHRKWDVKEEAAVKVKREYKSDGSVESAKMVRFREIVPVKNNRIICPFHEDKEPSGYINSHDWGDLVYCFPCEKAYDVIAYTMKTTGLDFKKAVGLLCGK